MDDSRLDRIAVLKRFLITVILLICLEVVKLLVQITVLFQYGWLLVSGGRSEPLRRFSNRLSEYAYAILRYSTLNQNDRPFPFDDFPDDGDSRKPEEPRFD